MPGEKIASARLVARREGVSLPTAVAALRMLESEGLIVAKPRSGYFVCSAHRTSPRKSAPASGARSVSLAGIMQQVYSGTRPVRVPLGAAFPDPQWLPVRSMQRALIAAARRIGRDAHVYSSPPGRVELRRQIALQASSWGAQFGPQDLVVTSGDTQALRLALQATCRPGDTVAIESPAYFGLLLLLQSLGLKALEIATHPTHGLDLQHLAGALRRQRVAAVVACPTAQNPLGTVMSIDDKRRLVELLEAAGVPLIEDDVFGDLAGGDARPPGCKAFDLSGNVLYCSSISKSMAPGWRIGWIAAGRFHERVLQMRWEESLAGSPLLEAAAAEMFARGEYRRHLRRFCPKVAGAVKAVAARVEASFPSGTRIARPAAGFLLWIELPPEVDAFAVHRHALEAGISVAPGHLFSAQGQFTHHVRLSCAVPVTPPLLRAVDVLAGICAEQVRSA